ncbi:hypothetical protein TNCV_2658111 [Trichonephila clavipes]|nr:hypothetical protein TNCV_2658111 [Trichonephila clavipes]
MELSSPSKFDQVSACAKLRDTVTGISALHLSIHGMDGRNSFMDMYISGKQAMIRRKAEMKGKDSTEEFIFPKRRLDRSLLPLGANSFSDLEQDVEHPPSIDTVTTTVVTRHIAPSPL